MPGLAMAQCVAGLVQEQPAALGWGGDPREGEAPIPDACVVKAHGRVR